MNDWFEAEQHVERAHEHYEAGRWEEAETELREALARNPYQAEWHFNLGLTLEAAGRYRDAAAAFGDAYGLGSEDAQTAILIGVNALRGDDPTLALRWLEQAEKQDPASPDSFVHRIEAYARLGQHEQAETMFYLAQQIDAENGEMYAAMADSLMDRNLHDRAVWCLREAARLDPEQPRVLAKLAEAYASTGRYERARQLYLKELRRDPGDIDTLLDLGSLLVDMNRYREAGEKFRRVLEIEPDNAEAHFSLGDLAEREEDFPGAIKQFDVVLRLDSKYPQARRRLAGLLIDQSDVASISRAQRLLRDELRDFAQRPEKFDPVDLDELGQLLLDAEMYREAVRMFSELLQTRSGDASVHHHLSVAYFHLGQESSGLEAARRALQLHPRHVPAMHNLAIAALRRGRWTRARYWLNQALRVDPDDPQLRRLRLRLRFHAVAEVSGWCAKPAIGLARRLRTRAKPETQATPSTAMQDPEAGTPVAQSDSADTPSVPTDPRS